MCFVWLTCFSTDSRYISRRLVILFVLGRLHTGASMCSPPVVFIELHVARVFCVIFSRSLFVLWPCSLDITLSVLLRFTASNMSCHLGTLSWFRKHVFFNFSFMLRCDSKCRWCLLYIIIYSYDICYLIISAHFVFRSETCGTSSIKS